MVNKKIVWACSGDNWVITYNSEAHLCGSTFYLGPMAKPKSYTHNTNHRFCLYDL